MVPDVGHSITVLCVAGRGFNYTARKDGNYRGERNPQIKKML
jgi:hypothetical protein